MINAIKSLAVASAVIASQAVTPPLYAHDSERPAESMMGSGMMGMMQQMSGMMEDCSRVMQSANQSGSARPNEQWRKDTSPDNRTPETNG